MVKEIINRTALAALMATAEYITVFDNSKVSLYARKGERGGLAVYYAVGSEAEYGISIFSTQKPIDYRIPLEAISDVEEAVFDLDNPNNPQNDFEVFQRLMSLDKFLRSYKVKHPIPDHNQDALLDEWMELGYN